MAFVLGERSLANLAGVHPRLAAVVRRAIAETTQDFTVIEGVRTKARQAELYGEGRTRAQLQAAGVDANLAKPDKPQVTWTTTSNHFTQADGFGHAVDLAPWPIDFNSASKFDAISRAMMQAAGELGVALRWGGDWNQNRRPHEKGETDIGHFELVR